jgi:hypothetical protein
MERRVIIFAAAIAMVAGCKQQPESPFANWIENPNLPEMGSSATAYDGYSKAARTAEILAGSLAQRMSISPTLRAKLELKLEPAVVQLREASKRQVLGYRFVPTDPSETPVQCKGWALLGRSLSYRIERSAQEGQLEKAIDDTICATKFGFDLLAGSAIEASLGMTIVDDARRTITPYLNKLGAGQLGRLNAGITTILQRRPLLSTTIDNERMNMRMGLQRIQDHYKSRDLHAIGVGLGADTDKAVAYLKEMQGKGDAERVTYFQGFADEIDTICKFWTDEAAKPAHKRERREGKPAIPLSEHRPWRRLAIHLTGSCEPLVSQFDATIARTRLFALETALSKAVKTQGFAPQDLAKYGDYSTDPFSGHTFAYRRDGRTFRVYSVGIDYQDDGGQTDESFTYPDLTIEHGA